MVRARASALGVLLAACDGGSGAAPAPEADATVSEDAHTGDIDGSAPDAARVLPDAAEVEPDGCVPNACGACGPAPIEVCNGGDDDCDGEVDEGVQNACGGCGEVPAEVCNEQDDDCDGEADEGVANACGGCGPVPEEVCNGVDDDCDTRTDEGTRNACGACGADPVEICNGRDDDCDGTIDEALDPDALPAELCNGVDDDCDDAVDEGLLNPCGVCGQVPVEVCNGEDDDCDGQTDEQVLNACGACGQVMAEACNGRDEDCDGEVDEGLLNACGACGPVPPEACNARDDDCDGEIDEFLPQNRCGDGCGPEPTEVCNRFDDDCDGTEDEGLPANACGFCGAPPQELCNLEDDDCDGEVDEGHAHNPCGGCGDAPPELCNREDDDCDGHVDENFDVGSNVDHCARCGDECPRNHSVPECLGGRCIVIRCEEGFFDEDGDGTNGCEAAIPDDVEAVWVDDDYDGVSDGSEQRPFTTIGAAMRVAEENARIFVRAGEYAERVVVSVRGVELVTPERARITMSVTVSADHARVTGFDVTSLVWLTCERGCAALRNRVTRGPVQAPTAAIHVEGGTDVTIAENEVVEARSDSTCRNCSRGYDAHGILIEGGRDVAVLENTVRHVHTDSSNPPGRAAGIRVVGVDGVLVSGNSVAELRAGDGVPNVGRLGGETVGILVEESVRVTLAGNDVDDLRGGDGSVSVFNQQGHDRPIGPGGPVVGIRLVDADQVVLRDNRLAALRGGTAGVVTHTLAGRQFSVGGRGGPATGIELRSSRDVSLGGTTFERLEGGLRAAGGDDGPAWALDVDDATTNVTSDASNRWDGTPVLFYDGVDVDLDGLEVAGRVPSRGGGIVVRNARSARLSGLRLADLDGHAGLSSADVWTVEPYNALPGETVYGLVVRDVREVSVRDVLMTDVTGGKAGAATHRDFGGPGGDVVGVHVSGAQTLDVSGLRLRRVAAGRGTEVGDDEGPPGRSTGLLVEDTLRATVDHVLADRLEGGEGGAAVQLGEGVGPVQLAHLTVGVAASGLRVSGAPVTIRDSVFSEIEGAVVVGEGVQMSYCAYDQVAELGPVEAVEVVDARCIDPFSEDLALLPDSPCVDGGTPGLACGDEPGGDDCRLDVGYLGGTAAGQSAD